MNEACEAYMRDMTRGTEDALEIPNRLRSIQLQVSLFKDLRKERENFSRGLFHTIPDRFRPKSLLHSAYETHQRTPKVGLGKAGHLGFLPEGHLRVRHFQCRTGQIGNESVSGPHS